MRQAEDQAAAARNLILPLSRSPRGGQTGGTPPLARARAGESAGPKPKAASGGFGPVRKKGTFFEKAKPDRSCVNKNGHLDLLTTCRTAGRSLGNDTRRRPL